MTKTKYPRKSEHSPSTPAPCSAHWELFKHMADNHGLTLLDSELEDICRVVEKMRMPLLTRHITGDVVIMSALEAMSDPSSATERARFTSRLLDRLRAYEAQQNT